MTFIKSLKSLVFVEEGMSHHHFFLKYPAHSKKKQTQDSNTGV